mgnify:CR=1 FL=1
MLFVLDVGNTNTVLGVFAAEVGFAREGGGEPRLLAHWRVSTTKTQTVDEYGVLFRNLFAMGKIDVGGIDGIVISSVPSRRLTSPAVTTGARIFARADSRSTAVRATMCRWQPSRASPCAMANPMRRPESCCSK